MSRYDPDAPEGAKPVTSQYVSLKDIRVILVLLPILGLIVYPVYKRMKMDGERKLCSTNLQQVSKALLVYAAQHDERFPPVYAEAEPGVPALQGGFPVTWISAVKPFMVQRATFLCPSAHHTENTWVYSSDESGKTESSFGMSLGMSAQPSLLLNAPSTTALLTETSNHGAMNSYNPLEFPSPEGGMLQNDGFLVGYDNPGGNREPGLGARFMTRLAFHDFLDDARPRHTGGNHVIFADGHLGRLTAADTSVSLLNDEPQGYWRAK